MQSHLIAKLFSVFTTGVDRSAAHESASPIELDATLLNHVAGGASLPSGSTAETAAVAGPHGGW